ncbi:hypothetical protein C8A05DRAFT_43789 [Staphylotrichum tortipilum]|uniref:Uncharacterized protein n=1 Tax=Staphylotrichum tortipilum TaxID=2831512 RepID=A0AAN6MMA4_9PEZI|nr:hypothetical protein C8A05DRAFT_43789 [Staphylotrichum longicolle]
MSAPAAAATTGAPLPTPTYGAGGSFAISCSSRIAAAPRDCLDVVVASSECTFLPPDQDNAAWNRFCRKCTIDSQPDDTPSDPTHLRLGTHFTFDVHLNPSEPDGAAAGQAIALQVSVLEPIDEPAGSEDGSPPRKGWRIAWKQRASLLMPAWLLRSERVQEFVEVEGGKETDYRCWETFYGLLAPVVRMAAAAQVERGFEAWSEGLKGRVEKGGRGE